MAIVGVDKALIELLITATPSIGAKLRDYLLQRGEHIKVSELHAIFLAQVLEILNNHTETLIQLVRSLRKLHGDLIESGVINS